jgi:hypothetical protein
MTHLKRNEDRDGEVAERAVAFTLTKPVDPARLDAELSKAMNWRKDGGLVIDGDAAQASTDAPVDVWVLRDDVDTGTLREVVAKHEPGEKVTAALPSLLAKAEAGEDLSPAEVQQALRELLRWTASAG